MADTPLPIYADESILDVCCRWYRERYRGTERSHSSPCLCDVEQAGVRRRIRVHVRRENIPCARGR